MEKHDRAGKVVGGLRRLENVEMEITLVGGFVHLDRRCTQVDIGIPNDIATTGKQSTP